MTIAERAKEYITNCRTVPANKMGRLQGYICGATEQRKIDIDKACEWLDENLIGYTDYDHLNGINIDYGQLNKQLRKAMEEELC